ncbi:MAG: hypothetical protein LBD58_09675 [Treponema sp.]|jgi:hypothetical protein|nr:hypothetical protein [Treponema sp.]
MRKKIAFASVFAGLTLGLMTACASVGGSGYAEQSAQGIDVFAGKNWNAPRRNNMYDRWEFNTDGTFHFWHVHHGEPLDRGVYRYEAKDGVLTVSEEGTEERAAYAYTFSGGAVTLTPVEHGSGGHGARGGASPEHGVAEDGGSAQAATGHAPSGGHRMGALPEAPVMFTHAR